MQLNHLDRFILGTIPTVSLRRTDDQAVIRFTTGYTASADYVTIVKVGDVYQLLSMYINTTDISHQVDFEQLFDYLSQRLREEKGWSFEVKWWAKKPTFTIKPNGAICVWLSNKIIAELKVGKLPNDSGVRISDINIVNPDGPTSKDYDMTVSALCYRVLDDVESALFMPKCRKAINDLVLWYYGLPPSAKRSVEISVSSELANEALDHSARLNAAVDVLTRCHGEMLPVMSVYMTSIEQLTLTTDVVGHELAKRFKLTNEECRGYVTVFIHGSPLIKIILKDFFKGFLRDVVLGAGSESAFFGKYKFINMDQYHVVIQDAVKEILYDYPLFNLVPELIPE